MKIKVTNIQGRLVTGFKCLKYKGRKHKREKEKGKNITFGVLLSPRWGEILRCQREKKKKKRKKKGGKNLEVFFY